MANGSNFEKDVFKWFTNELKNLVNYAQALLKQKELENCLDEEETINNYITILKDFEKKCPPDMSEEDFFNTLTDDEKKQLTEARYWLGTPIFVPTQNVMNFRYAAASKGIRTGCFIIEEDEEFKKKLVKNGADPATVYNNSYRAIYYTDVDRNRMEEFIKDTLDRGLIDGKINVENKIIRELTNKTNIGNKRVNDGFGRLSQNYFDKNHPIDKEGERVTIGDDLSPESGLTDTEVNLLHDKCINGRIPFYATKLSNGRYKITTLKSKLPIMQGFIQSTLIDSTGTLGQATALIIKESRAQKIHVNEAIKDKKPCFIVNKDKAECIEIKNNGSELTASFYRLDFNGKPIPPAIGEIKAIGNFNKDNIDEIESWAEKMDYATIAVMTPEEFNSSSTDFAKHFNKKNTLPPLALHELSVVETIYDEAKIHNKLDKFFSELYTEKNFTVLPKRLQYLVGLSLKKAVYKGLANDYNLLSSVINTINGFEDGHPFKFDIPSKEQADAYAIHATEQLEDALEIFENDPNLGNGKTEVMNDLRELFDNVLVENQSLSEKNNAEAGEDIGKKARMLFSAAQSISKACSRSEQMDVAINGKSLNDITRRDYEIEQPQRNEEEKTAGTSR